MTDELESTEQKPIEPISASADGTRNMQSLSCSTLGQRMNYAACLWRQGVLAKPDIRKPADWAPCASARSSGTCRALQMRSEEEIAGKAIYFQDRGTVRRISDTVRQWIMPSTTKKAATPAHALDTLGSAPTLAEAVTAAAKEQQARAPEPEPKPEAPKVRPSFVDIKPLPGESPLDALRRVRAQANNPSNQPS